MGVAKVSEPEESLQARKSITSLLLTATATKDDRARVLRALRSVLSGHQLSPDSIEVQDSRQQQNEQEFIIDFSHEIDHGLEDYIFLTQFMRSHEHLISEILQVNAIRELTLSAMIVVDPGLALFGLAGPKVPAVINNSDNFMFHYSVWHVLDSRAD
jgi:hypothetical protein